MKLVVQIIRRLTILVIWGSALAMYSAAWKGNKTTADGIVIDPIPFVGITIVAIAATVIVSWIFSTKEPKQPE
jgi:hypothetical protein